jgi:BTB/POZ domain
MLNTSNRRFGREIVHIKVGTALQDFGIHKDHLCNTSPYFHAAFNSGFEEAKTGIMTLESTDLNVFEIFYAWLYTTSLKDEESVGSWPGEMTLLRLYVFADMAQIPALQNAIIRELYEEIMCKGLLGTEFVTLDDLALKYVWDNTTKSSRLRKFLVGICVWEVNGDIEFSDVVGSGMTIGMCLQIMRAMKRRMSSTPYPTNPLLNLSNYDEPIPEEKAKM